METQEIKNRIKEKHKKSLDRLCAGREFADYLLVNGWEVLYTRLGQWSEKKGYNDNVCFTKQTIENGHQCEYTLTYDGDEHGSTFSCLKKNGKDRTRLHSEIFGHDIEEMPRFAFLCDAMGFVSLAEANKNCKIQTGKSLIQSLLNEIKKDTAITGDVNIPSLETAN